MSNPLDAAAKAPAVLRDEKLSDARLTGFFVMRNSYGKQAHLEDPYLRGTICGRHRVTEVRTTWKVETRRTPLDDLAAMLAGKQLCGFCWKLLFAAVARVEMRNGAEHQNCRCEMISLKSQTSAKKRRS